MATYSEFKKYMEAKQAILGGQEYKETTTNENGVTFKVYATEKNGVFYERTENGRTEYWSDKDSRSRYYKEDAPERITLESLVDTEFCRMPLKKAMELWSQWYIIEPEEYRSMLAQDAEELLGKYDHIKTYEVRLERDGWGLIRPFAAIRDERTSEVLRLKYNYFNKGFMRESKSGGWFPYDLGEPSR